jgi:hypothetical protein
MANKLFAEVVIAGSYKNLAKSTRGATKELKGFEASTKKMANAVKGALAGVALMGVGMVFDALVDMTKAAAEDAKSMALLNKQMEKSWKATDQTKSSMDDYIKSVSHMTGIVDDDLRPAFGKIVRATKNASQATAAFDNVLNIAADRQVDVNTVANAYSKYLAGNKTALYRLIPGLKGARNEAEYLKNTYEGMAKIAGKNDPFARISVIFEDFKEKLGTAFLPLFEKFADWLASDEAQTALDSISDKFEALGEWFASPEGQEAMAEWMDNLKALIKLAGDFLGLVAEVVKLFGSQDTAGTAALRDRRQAPGGPTGRGGGGVRLGSPDRVPTTTLSNNSNINPPVVNVYMDPITGKSVVKIIKTEARRKGVDPRALIG